MNTIGYFYFNIYNTRKKYRRLSDGPIDGLNNSIEKIHNNGNGFNSFGNFKKLVLFKINKFLPYKFN